MLIVDATPALAVNEPDKLVVMPRFDPPPPVPFDAAVILP